MAKKLNSIEQTFAQKDENSTPRAMDISRSGDNFERLKIGLMDIDKAILTFIKDNIKPTIYQNNQIIEVDTIFANDELFNSIQSNGYFRDKNGKILFPLIVIKRSSVTKNLSYLNKIDGNNPTNFFYIKKSNNPRDIYQNNVNGIKSEKYIKIPVPDFVDIVYDVITLTNYIEHQNELVEQFLYFSNSYWGDYSKKSFKFLSKVENFSDDSEISVEGERIIKSSFSINTVGKLISATHIEIEHNLTHINTKTNINK